MFLLYIFVAFEILINSIFSFDHRIQSSEPVLSPELIHRINSDPSSSWRAAIAPPFVGKSIGDVQSLLLPPILSSARPADPTVAKSFSVASLPTNFDTYQQWPHCACQVRDQGQCASSVMIAIAETMTDRFCIASGNLTILSPQDLVSCDPKCYGCSGAYLKEQWQYVESTGIVTEYCFPYVSGKLHRAPTCPYECLPSPSLKWEGQKHFAKENSTILFSSVDEAMASMVQFGSIMSAMTVYQEFYSYAGGIYDCYGGGMELGSVAVKLQGFGVDLKSGKPYWIGVLSWGVGEL